MKINWVQQLIGNDVLLVPYCEHHVEQYHKWMENEALREQTCSERLSYEEEKEMQQSWHLDEKKCTFIILYNKVDEEKDMSLYKVKNEDGYMVGDVNLFLNDDDKEGEISLMIAEESVRRKGVAKQAALMMMEYGIIHLGITSFVAKISDTNIASISLFKKIGFIQTNHDLDFQEVEMKYSVNEIKEEIKEIRSIKVYHHLD